MKKTIYNIRPEVKYDSAVKVSYSQFNMYKSCPLQWKLNYVDGYKISEPSIHTTFGTAMHNTIQLFLDTMYNKSVKAANNIGLQSLFKDFLVEEYATQKTNNNNTHFSNPKELNDFYYDGINILDYFLKKRSAYFSSRNCKLIGIEIPVQVETDTNHNVLFNGFLDLVLEVNNRIKIIDIKTSTKGWNTFKKKLEGDQLRLYKRYFSKLYGHDEDKIDIEYFIVKRKLYEDTDFPQKRIQLYKPTHGSVSMNRTNREFSNFIKNAFLEDGSYNKDAHYSANSSACRFCPFKTNYELCPISKRVSKE